MISGKFVREEILYTSYYKWIKQVNEAPNSKQESDKRSSSVSCCEECSFQVPQLRNVLKVRFQHRSPKWIVDATHQRLLKFCQRFPFDENISQNSNKFVCCFRVLKLLQLQVSVAPFNCISCFISEAFFLEYCCCCCWCTVTVWWGGERHLR